MKKMWDRWWAVVVIAGLGIGLARLAFADSQQPPSEPSASSTSQDAKASGTTSVDSQSNQHPRRFTPLAKQSLEAARARREEQQLVEAEKRRRQEQAKAERERVRQRQEAQRIAVQLSRQKLAEQASKGREAQRQLQLARERQLKVLYQRALMFYHQGAYQEASETLQQMVVMDPAHPLVKSAERLMSFAEMKQFEQRLRASAEGLPPGTKGAAVPELEQLLTQKRMELETAVKYAKEALHEQKYDTAQKLLTAILVQNPHDREAQQLLEQVQLAQIREDRERYTHQVNRDEEMMNNDVLKAQLLPETRQPSAPSPQMLMSDMGSTVLAKLQEPISFEFNEVALNDVLQFLADAANVSIVPSPHLDLKGRRVSLKVKDLPLEQAIKYLAKSLSLAYRVERDAILLASPEEFSNEPLQTRVFFLQNGIGPFALKTAAVEPNPALAMESVTDLLGHSIPQVPGSKFVVDERSGALVVTNTADNLLLAERLLSQLDITPIQVLIEARFIELTMDGLQQFSLEAVLNGNAALVKKGAADGTRGASQQIASGSGFQFPALARESEGVNLTLQGVLTGTQFESVLHALEESQKTKTLSSPRVTTLNNQTAQISVAEEFNYPTRYQVQLVQFDINGDGDFDDAGETEFANVPQDFQKRDIGILLNVTPSVGKDMKTITLVLAPEVSSFSQFRDLGGGVKVPEFTSSQLTTSVVIENGQTIVLGGLMKDQTSNTVTKIPVLGDIPLLGNLFRQKEASSERKNLLIFITARLLAPRGQTT